MPQFSLRYQGDDAPEPETLFARDAVEALDLARERFATVPAPRAVLWSDGAILHVLARDQEDMYDQGRSLDQLLASAGVYVIDRSLDRA